MPTNITHLGDDIPPKWAIIINYLNTLTIKSDISTIPGSVVDYLHIIYIISTFPRYLPLSADC
jgi:hypothetical protein